MEARVCVEGPMRDFVPIIEVVYDTSIIPDYFKKTPSWYTEEHKTVALLGAAIFCFEKEKQLHSQVSVGKGSASTTPSKWRTTRASQYF